MPVWYPIIVVVQSVIGCRPPEHILFMQMQIQISRAPFEKRIQKNSPIVFELRLFWSDRFFGETLLCLYLRKICTWRRHEHNTKGPAINFARVCVNDIAGCCWPSTIGDAYQSSAFSLWLRMRLLTCLLIFRFSYLTKKLFHTLENYLKKWRAKFWLSFEPTWLGMRLQRSGFLK